MDKMVSTPAVGDLKISQDVISAISRVAALEIEGVDSLAELPRKRGIFWRPIVKKAIGVALNDDFVNVAISVNLQYGAKISEVCPAIQNAIKENVQTMTGMAVSKVNVLVSGIVFPEEKEEN